MVIRDGSSERTRGVAARRLSDVVALAAFLAICFAIAAAGGLATATSVQTWYPGLAKPVFNPPSWLFGPVWTVLYAMIAVAGWRVWRRRRSPGARRALIAYAVQLALNVFWSILFFGQRLIGVALVEIVALLISIVVATLLMWRVDRVAGMLFVPYVAWVGFATLLNGSIWYMN